MKAEMCKFQIYINVLLDSALSDIACWTVIFPRQGGINKGF